MQGVGGAAWRSPAASKPPAGRARFALGPLRSAVRLRAATSALRASTRRLSVCNRRLRLLNLFDVAFVMSIRVRERACKAPRSNDLYLWSTLPTQHVLQHTL